MHPVRMIVVLGCDELTIFAFQQVSMITSCQDWHTSVNVNKLPREAAEKYEAWKTMGMSNSRHKLPMVLMLKRKYPKLGYAAPQAVATLFLRGWLHSKAERTLI